MIEFTDTYGKRIAVHPATIDRITEAGASSQWHGARALVRMLEGTFLEVNESFDRVAAKLSQLGSP